MSQIIVPNKIPRRGKEIERHLRSLNLEPWFLRSEILVKNEDYEIDTCPYCNQQLKRPYWESRYNGLKAKCILCEVTWNLS